MNRPYRNRVRPGGVDTATKVDFINVDLLPPVADFSEAQTSGNPPLFIQFTNVSDLDGALNPVYLWDFGDGNTSTDESPGHTCEAVGSYTVPLTVTTLGGEDILTKTDLIVVKESKNFVLTFQEHAFGSEFLSASISTKAIANGTVFLPGLLTQSFTVAPGIVTEIPILIAAATVGSDITTSTGIRVTADSDISVYGLNQLFSNSTDGFTAIAVGTLGKEYFVMSAEAVSAGSGRSQRRCCRAGECSPCGRDEPGMRTLSRSSCASR